MADLQAYLDLRLHRHHDTRDKRTFHPQGGSCEFLSPAELATSEAWSRTSFCARDTPSPSSTTSSWDGARPFLRKPNSSRLTPETNPRLTSFSPAAASTQ